MNNWTDPFSVTCFCKDWPWLTSFIISFSSSRQIPGLCCHSPMSDSFQIRSNSLYNHHHNTTIQLQVLTASLSRPRICQYKRNYKWNLKFNSLNIFKIISPTFLKICAITILNILTLSYNYIKDPLGGPFRLYDHGLFSRIYLLGKESRYIV